MTIFRRPTTAAASGDPIPFTFGDDIHLFYLSSPSGTLDYPERVRTTWQHAKTTDLRTWEHLPPAVEPGPVSSYDGGGIWTGSVVEHEGTFYLFYTGHHVGAENPQTICVATSSDLIHFTKHEANPLVGPPPTCEPVDWRDPYVFWNEQERKWWMLIAARLAEGPYWQRGCIMLATSDDLLEWTVEEEPFHVPGNTYCPECPEMWADENGRWHLVYSRFSEEVGTVSRVADTARGPFREPARPELGGRRWYAAKSAPVPGTEHDERVFFGWVHDEVTDSDRGHRWLWGGDFTLPRIITPSQDGTLAVRPIMPDWNRQVADKNATVDVPGAAHLLPLADSLPDRAIVRLNAVFPDEDRPSRVGINLVTDERFASWQIDVSPRSGDVRLARVPAPLDDFWADLTGRGAEYREVDGPLQGRTTVRGQIDSVELVAVIDGELLEVYVNDQVALTHRIGITGLAAAVRVEDGRCDITAEVFTI